MLETTSVLHMDMQTTLIALQHAGLINKHNHIFPMNTEVNTSRISSNIKHSRLKYIMFIFVARDTQMMTFGGVKKNTKRINKNIFRKKNLNMKLAFQNT